MQRIVLSFALTLSLTLAACSESPTGPLSVSSPAGPDSAEPYLAVGPDGRTILSWLEAQEDDTTLLFAELNDDRWGSSHTVATGGDWFVNWADFPSIVPLAGDFWAAHWLVRNPDDSFAYDVVIATSMHTGLTWSDPLMPRRDGTATEHGFVRVLPN